MADQPESLEKAVLGMYSLIQETGMEKASRQDALYSLLEGNALFAFGGSDLEVLFSDLPEEEKQSLGYLSLTPYVTGYAVFLSENSKNPEAAFDFILEALQSESYEESIRKQGLEPVTVKKRGKSSFFLFKAWNPGSQSFGKCSLKKKQILKSWQRSMSFIPGRRAVNKKIIRLR